MILLAVFAFLPLSSTTEPFRDHLSDALKLKCDALPYRTTFVNDRCYFAVQKQVEHSKSSAECSSIFTGAKVSSDAPGSVFDAMMVEKSKFHTGSSSSESKQLICAYDNGYKCDAAGTMLSNGRCVVRAQKSMNFVDAKKYCEDRGMQLPAPSNDLDNRIVRDALVNVPAWVDKSVVRANGLKWKQGNIYSRWSTCNWTAGHKPRLFPGSQNKLWQCNNDMASVIDRSGYWSNGRVDYTMDVVCLKNAENPFTKGAPSCNYYEANVEEFTPVTGAACGTVYSTTCYSATRTSTRYETLGKATVETRRGCEVLCDNKPKCIAFAFKDDGFSSACVLLSSSTSKEVCSATTTIFLKKSGCGARTNITAEFGEDPCIDEMVPSVFSGFNKWQICEKNKQKQYIVRAIDLCGRRITLDNEHWNYLQPVGNMWEFKFWEKGYAATTHLVAATCVRAGGEKCPCEPLKHLNIPGTYPATTDKENPCKGTGSQFWYDVAKCPAYSSSGTNYYTQYETTKAFVICQAGMWMLWKEASMMSWGVTGLACWN